MKLDTEINKVNSDALFVISNATDLLFKFLTEKSSEVAIEKKWKTIKLEHLRIAVKSHRPTFFWILSRCHHRFRSRRKPIDLTKATRRRKTRFQLALTELTVSSRNVSI
ncbi:putative transcription factor Hap3/NF-YB family [Helianthus debilis subsp. tardiflorus]